MKNLFLPQNLTRKAGLITFLFIINAMLCAQDKTYASSQSYQTNGPLCVGCTVINPQNAVGNNENDFAAITIPVSLLPKSEVQQTLIFPAATTRHFKKIVIGIGSPSHILSAKLLGGEAYVESFSGTVSNGDKTLIDNNMLELNQDQKKGTIAFTPKKFFDRIKITLNGGVLGLNDVLQIYYAYHTPDKFTTCGNPPLDPLAYYSFDGNANDIISGYNFSTSNIDFPGSMVCGSALYAGKNLGYLKLNLPTNSKIKTIAFWAIMDNVPLYTDGNSSFEIKLSNGNNKIKVYTNKLEITDKIATDEYIPINPFFYDFKKRAEDHFALNELAHFTLVCNEESNWICLYKNGILSGNQSCGNLQKIYEDFATVKIELEQAKIDELLMYDRALTADEVKALACSYGKLPNCTSTTPAPASKMASTPAETFTVSPNPTTGEVTLDGNILLVGSDISIRNTSGTEVYHAAFTSKTFALPATLPAGVYMLTLQTKDKKVYTRKIILTR